MDVTKFTYIFNLHIFINDLFIFVEIGKIYYNALNY